MDNPQDTILAKKGQLVTCTNRHPLWELKTDLRKDDLLTNDLFENCWSSKAPFPFGTHNLCPLCSAPYTENWVVTIPRVHIQDPFRDHHYAALNINGRWVERFSMGGL